MHEQKGAGWRPRLELQGLCLFDLFVGSGILTRIISLRLTHVSFARYVPICNGVLEPVR